MHASSAWIGSCLIRTSMRSIVQLDFGFMVGVGVGLALAGVTVVTVEAARRMRTRRALWADHMPVIDGVHPPAVAELEARPAEEANASEVPRLESEAVDVPPTSQRWV